MKNILKYLFIPLFLYLIFFIILTYPAINSLSSHFFADQGDGSQNAWNIWWINKAITQLHTSIWFTKYLHFPYGTSLIGHTLNPFNGFMGILLLKLFTLTEVYNIIVIFSFVISGLTAFLLSHKITKNYFASLVGGYIFTFSSYHFAHAEGHMQLISMEWLPAFILCWYLFIKEKRRLFGFLSIFFLYLVLLCDYYYFFYATISALILYFWQAKSNKNLLYLFKFLSIKYLILLLIFVSITILPIIGSLTHLQLTNPFVGSHEPSSYSADLLAFIIPGGHSVFSPYTKFYWSRLPGNIHESSIYLGWTCLLIIIFVWSKRKYFKKNDVNIWFLLLIIFFIFSLGPYLQIGGKSFTNIILPYSFLEYLPMLKLSGVPVRMTAMITLFISIVVSIGIAYLYKKKKTFFIIIICLGTFIELFPRKITLFKNAPPPGIIALKNIPENKYGVIDLYYPPGLSEYYQTIYEKPKALGYIARSPISVIVKDVSLLEYIGLKDFKILCEKYKLKYLIMDKKIKLVNKKTNTTMIPIYSKDPQINIYNMCDKKYWIYD